jgi:hypothetical protein
MFLPMFGCSVLADIGRHVETRRAKKAKQSPVFCGREPTGADAWRIYISPTSMFCFHAAGAVAPLPAPGNHCSNPVRAIGRGTPR